MSKPCPDCGETNEIMFDSVFRKDRNGQSYRLGRCRKCHRIYSNARNKKNKERYARLSAEGRYNINKDEQLKALYGISLFQYNLILKSQNGICPCCGFPINPGDRLATDHTETPLLKVHGILHANCNTGIGMFQDNPEALHNAAEYARRTRLK